MPKTTLLFLFSAAIFLFDKEDRYDLNDSFSEPLPLP